jgi:hypothetical protein
MLHQPVLWVAVFAAALTAVCALFMGVTSPAPFGYDEADYMFAGTQGVWANYTDRGAMPLAEFVGKGRELSRDPTRRAGMSQYVRSSGDLSFYRHYHGPLYAYWIGLCQALGVRTEAAYRASGMILHGLGALAILWFFPRAFPELPGAAAFLAAAMYALNRTAIVTGTFITQHIVFEVLAFLSLFAMAIFCRTRDVRWWYCTAALVAGAFAAVEISSVLMIAVALSLVLNLWADRRTEIFPLLGKGALWFLGTLVAIWPRGVLTLNALKGYLYLAYMTLYRKTFNPIGPGELWGFKIKTYPLEFALPLVALVALLLFWRRISVRTAALPFLIYACMFLGVTMVVTIPYVYYHGSLLASLAILTGIGFGELWRRTGVAAGTAALVVILGTLVLQANSYYKEAAQARRAPSFSREILRYLDRASGGGPVYISFLLVPALHYYHPEVATVGYDQDWSIQRLAAESMAAAPARVICEEKLCRQLAALWPVRAASDFPEPVGHMDRTGEAVYAISLNPR